MKIWHRYLFRQIASVFTLLFLALFAIYLLVDLSVHGIRFSQADTSTADIILYYLYSFAASLDLFMPLAFLLACLKVCFDLVHRFEFLSLQMAGLSQKRLLIPFYLFALLLTSLSLANHQFFAPKALAFSQAFKSAHAKKKKIPRQNLQNILLPDGSEIVYHQFDPNTQELNDLFWIRSKNEIWHIKTLSIPTRQAHFADELIFENHKLIKKNSFEEITLNDLESNFTPSLFIPFHSRPLLSLLRDSLHSSSEQTLIQTHLYHKFASSLFSLLALLSVAPFALTFSRQTPTFLIVSLSLFAFIVFMTLFDALVILGENNVLPPVLAMWSLPALTLALSLGKFMKKIR